MTLHRNFTKKINNLRHNRRPVCCTVVVFMHQKKIHVCYSQHVKLDCMHDLVTAL
jgi:hypothetical protein